MTKTLLISICCFVLVILTSVFFIVIKSDKNGSKSLGGVAQGQSYMSTTTHDFGTVSAGSSKLLKNGDGEFGSVIITNSTAGSFNLYDATSTNHGDHATTTLAKVGASLAAGTYIFDVVFSRGLLVEFQSSNIASSTITWR